MSKRDGFTLIELLVVISIIAMLMAMLMPALSRVRAQAKNVVCRANMKQFAIAWAVYSGDNEGFLFADDWEEDLEPYYKNRELCFCPTTTKNVDTGARIGSFLAWPPTGVPRASYGVNQWACATPETNNTYQEAMWKTTFKGVSNAPLLGECAIPGATPLFADTPGAYDGQFWENDSGGSVNEMRRMMMNRHNGHTNMLFIDFSARPVNLTHFWRLKWHRQWNDAGAAGPVFSDYTWLRKYVRD